MWSRRGSRPRGKGKAARSVEIRKLWKVRPAPVIARQAGFATLENDVRLAQAVTLVKQNVVYVRQSLSGESIVADIRRPEQNLTSLLTPPAQNRRSPSMGPSRHLVTIGSEKGAAD